MNRRRRVVSACTVVVTLGALSACTSQPGNRRVVSDVIESLQLPAAEEACMLERLEGYTNDQLAVIAEENETWDPAGGSTLEQASPAMRQYIADFEECTAEGGATGESTGTSEPSGSSEPSPSTAPSDSTEPVASTTPSETTEA